MQGKMFGAPGHGDYEHAQVSVFIGKNPWQSHGFARARTALLAMQKDPARSLVVIDPRRSETAAMADIHLAIAPGTDAWCLAAIIGVIVQEQLVNSAWVQAHTTGSEQVLATFDRVPVAAYAAICGVPEAQLRETARLIARADSVSVFEDLGLQMNLHSTLNSYLQRLMWTLTGHYGRPGTANAFVPFLSLAKASKGETSDSIASGPRVERRSPVTGAKIVIGLIPCNVIPDEILTEHPKRFRAMLIESGNPAHSLADSQRMRAAIRSLELSVVIDVAMTETARIADYVLPAASQFEKVEATFFNTEFPRNTFHLRQPLFAPLRGTLPEAEIHARLCEALGALSVRDYWPLRIAARLGRTPFTLAFGAMAALRPLTMRFAPVLLYRTLGETLPVALRSAAVVWGIAQRYVMGNRTAAARAGFTGSSPSAANRLFQQLLDTPSGVVFAESTYDESWTAIGRPEHRIGLAIPELLAEATTLETTTPPHDDEFPFVLSAGERRTDTSNTSVRDASWHVRGRFGTLRMHPEDAARLGCSDGERVRLSTRRGSVEVEVEATIAMRVGCLSLPNGQGLRYQRASGEWVERGVAPNELTDNQSRDRFMGTPWHKRVPARVERLTAPAPTVVP